MIQALGYDMKFALDTKVPKTLKYHDFTFFNSSQLTLQLYSACTTLWTVLEFFVACFAQIKFHALVLE